MGKDIKIFVVGHKKFNVPKSSLLIPIQAGASINNPIEGFLKDNDGENISPKNPFYSELTAQYYVMKNIEADYYGFFHYRRYLNFSDNTSSRPYVYYAKKVGKIGSYIHLDNAPKLIEDYDILLPTSENFQISVRDQYNSSDRHTDKEAFQNIIDITRDLYPNYTEDIDSYVEGYENYLGNMYIMKKEIAIQYFEFLSNIFAEFDEKYKEVPPKTQGFLSERLFGVFFNHLVRTTKIKYKFLQRVDILEYYDKKILRRLIYLFLPPGSKIRACVKKIKNRRASKT